MIYCYPKLSAVDLLAFRLFGPGLGNLLFPWARATVHAHMIGGQLIVPTWLQFKLGPLLRRDADMRHYGNLFIPTPGALDGVNRWAKLCLARRIPEQRAASARDGEVVEFSGMADWFTPVLRHHALVRDALIGTTHPRHKAGLQFDFSDTICLHVRMGDFIQPSDAALHSGALNMRIPLAWYIGMVQGIRARYGAHLRVHVFSDGTNEDLAPLLALDRCQRLQFGSAIADLLALSRARMLVASGSTFSMWASYLGRMPTVWHPGQKKQNLYDSTEPFEIEAMDFQREAPDETQNTHPFAKATGHAKSDLPGNDR